MVKLASLGKWLFALPMAVFGSLHFGPLEFSLPYVPDWLTWPAFWVYLAGAGLLLFTLSAILKRFDRLAAILLGVELLLFVILIHLPKAFSGDFLGIIATFRDIAMAGAAWMFASRFAYDRRLNITEAGPQVNDQFQGDAFH